jgi:hypothetical protein
MKAFVAGTIFGIVITTVGLSGLFKLFDNGVAKVQQVTKEAAQ